MNDYFDDYFDNAKDGPGKRVLLIDAREPFHQQMQETADVSFNGQLEFIKRKTADNIIGLIRREHPDVVAIEGSLLDDYTDWKDLGIDVRAYSYKEKYLDKAKEKGLMVYGIFNSARCQDLCLAILKDDCHMMEEDSAQKAEPKEQAPADAGDNEASRKAQDDTRQKYEAVPDDAYPARPAGDRIDGRRRYDEAGEDDRRRRRAEDERRDSRGRYEDAREDDRRRRRDEDDRLERDDRRGHRRDGREDPYEDRPARGRYPDDRARDSRYRDDRSYDDYDDDGYDRGDRYRDDRRERSDGRRRPSERDARINGRYEDEQRYDDRRRSDNDYDRREYRRDDRDRRSPRADDRDRRDYDRPDRSRREDDRRSSGTRRQDPRRGYRDDRDGYRRDYEDDYQDEYDSYPRPSYENEEPLPYVIAVYSGKGGVGKTTISTNLASQLACTQLSKKPTRVLLVDSNIDAGNVLSTLRLSKEDAANGRCMTAWLRDIVSQLKKGVPEEKIVYSRGNIEEYLQIDKRTGLYVLPAPISNFDAAEFGPQEQEVMYRNLVEYGGFDYIVFDTGNTTRDSASIALRMSDCILLIMTQDINALESNMSVMHSFDQADFFSMDKVCLIVNKARKKKDVTFSSQDIVDWANAADHLPRRAKPYKLLTEFYDSNKVRSATNNQRPLCLTDKGDEFMKSIGDIVKYVVEKRDEKNGRSIPGTRDDEEKPKKGFFARLFGRKGKS